MFKKILIANRGEIAYRIIRTARRLGIKTAAVCSEADARALHVEMSDEAVLIGPPPAAESYLDIGKILDAVKETGSQAVHPGYGFLSENAEFAKALDEAGVVFIGPGPKAMTVMGDKIESKRRAEAAGVSTVPGGAGALAAHAGAAFLGLEMLLITEIDQGIEVFDCLENDVAAAAAIAAVGPAILDIFFTAEADRTGTAAATAHINLGFIEKLHNRSFGRTRLSFCIGTPAREDRASTRHKIHISHKTREE